MSLAPLRKACPGCQGRGVVPRARRTIDGKPDPFDTRTEETCATCGGSGKVNDPGPAGEASKAADADHGSCCY